MGKTKFLRPLVFLHQISVNSNETIENAFKRGLPMLDGSSIKGFKEIYESDMLLKPYPSTFAILPDYFDKNHHHGRGYAYPSRTARMFVDIMRDLEEKGIPGIAGISHKKPKSF